MRDYLAELIAVSLLPLLLIQGRHARRRTPRLPDASGACTGMAGSGQDQPPLRLLALGESPVAGVGVQTHPQAITACLADALASQLQRPVEWRACGRNGCTVRQACSELLTEVPAQPVDVAMVAFGVNDTTAFRPVVAWQRDVAHLLDALQERCRPRLILLSGVPPVGAFPALPQPLRAVLGLKAAALDRALAGLALARDRTLHVPLLLDTRDPLLMAHDGYHPSAAGCVAWAALLAGASLGPLANLEAR